MHKLFTFLGPKSSNRVRLQLNETQIKVCHDTLALLANTATLAFENHDKPLILFTDASNTHVCGITLFITLILHPTNKGVLY